MGKKIFQQEKIDFAKSYDSMNLHLIVQCYLFQSCKYQIVISIVTELIHLSLYLLLPTSSKYKVYACRVLKLYSFA